MGAPTDSWKPRLHRLEERLDLRGGGDPDRVGEGDLLDASVCQRRRDLGDTLRGDRTFVRPPERHPDARVDGEAVAAGPPAAPPVVLPPLSGRGALRVLVGAA